jgi:tetratricopeptide (TPR) repeat protein
MIRSRYVGITLAGCLAGLLVFSCSKGDRPTRAEIAHARQEQLVQRQREAAVQEKENVELSERLQTLHAIAGRERESLEARSRDFHRQWQTYFAKRSEQKKTAQKIMVEELAGLSAKDRELVRAIEEKLKAGKSLEASEEEFAMDKKGLEKPLGTYLLHEVREYPARKRFLFLIPHSKSVVERAEEEERLERAETKAHPDLEAFTLQVKQIKQAGELIHNANYDQAVSALTKALDKSPFVPEFYALRGAVYCLAGLDLDKAMADLNEAQKLNPEDAWVWYCRGVAQWIKGNPAPARADFREAVQRDNGLIPLVRKIDPNGN